MKPLVSVKTISYSHAPCIRQCIEGVLMQQRTLLVKHIIGEDCSTEGTRETVPGEDESQVSTGEACTDCANRHADGCDSAVLRAGSGVRHGGLPADA